MFSHIVLKLMVYMYLNKDQADYCYSQEQKHLQSYEACASEVEARAGQMNWIVLLIILGVVAAIYFYNKGLNGGSQSSGPA